MRSYQDIFVSYTKWLVEKTKDNKYSYEATIERFENKKHAHAYFYKQILKLCHGKNGMFYFCKFIIGDLKDCGYPKPFRYNGVLHKWTKLINEHSKISVLASRGLGKSVFFSEILSLYSMFIHKYFRIIIVSASGDQSVHLLDEIKTIVSNNEWLLTKKDKNRWASQTLGFNSGYIIGVGIGSEILGQHVDRIILDDILRDDNKLSDEQTEDYIDMKLDPMLLNRNGQMVLVGTPKRMTDYFSVIKKRIREEPECPWVAKEFPAIINEEDKILQAPDRFTWKSIMAKKASMGALKFAREYQLQFFSRDKSLFPKDVIDMAKDMGRDCVMEQSKPTVRGANWMYIGGCLPDGEKVFTNKGVRNIEEVINEDLKLYDENYKLTNIINYQKTKYEGNLYEITPAHTKISTKFTDEHPIQIFENGKKIFKRVDELKQGDLLCLPKKINGDTPIDLDHSNKGFVKSDVDTDTFDFGRLVGLYLAEGWVRYPTKKEPYVNSIHLHFHRDEKYLINFVSDYVKSEFNRKCKIIYSKKCKVCSISFSYKPLAEFLKNFGRYAENKHIPMHFKFSDEFKKGLIRGYWEGDGSIKQDKRRNHKLINYVSISSMLLTGIQHLLYELNIESKLRVLRYPKKCEINGHKFICKTCYELNLSAIETNKFIDAIGIKESHNDVNLKWYGKRKMSPIIREDMVLIPIESLQESYFDGWVNNFETESHTYMHYNIVGHNCDVARSGSASADFTVVFIIAYDTVKQTKQIVYKWRSKGLKMGQQAAKIAEIAKKFDNCGMVVETNNMGQDLIDRLVDDFNVYVEPMTIGGAAKKEELVRFLVQNFENDKVILPMGDEYSREMSLDLISELEMFGVQVTAAGNERYCAVGGGHDDQVMALAHAIKGTQILGMPFAVTNFDSHNNDAFAKMSNVDETDLVKLINMGFYD